MQDERIGGVSAIYRTGIQEMFGKLPVKIETMACVVGELSLGDAVSGLMLLQGISQRINCEVKFFKGDYMIALSSQYGDKAKVFRQAFGAHWEPIYNEFCVCAGVARRWPADKRNGSKSFNFHLRSRPNGMRYDKIIKAHTEEDGVRTHTIFTGSGNLKAFLSEHGLQADTASLTTEEACYVLNTATRELRVNFEKPTKFLSFACIPQGSFDFDDGDEDTFAEDAP